MQNRNYSRFKNYTQRGMCWSAEWRKHGNGELHSKVDLTNQRKKMIPNPSSHSLVKIEWMKKKIECEKCSVNVLYQGNLCFSEITNCDQNNENT